MGDLDGSKGGPQWAEGGPEVAKEGPEGDKGDLNCNVCL